MGKNLSAAIEPNRNLKVLLENIPDIVYSLNPDGIFINVNEGARDILGYQPEELEGTSVFQYIHEDDLREIKQSFEEAMRSGKGERRRVVLRMKSKNGEIKHLEVNRRLVVEDGRVIRQDGVARDITDRIRLQQELQAKSDELEGRIHERTERLEYANTQLAALNAVSNRFSLIFTEKQLIDEVPRLLCTSLDFDRATLFFEKNGELELMSFSMEKDSEEMVQRFLDNVHSDEYSMPPHLIESLNENKTVFVPDLNADPRWPREPGRVIRTKSIVVSPIKVDKKPVGVLVGNMQHHEREMDSQDVARFEMFANMVSLALANIRVYQSLETKVIERTKELRSVNAELRKRAKEREKTTYSLGKANIKLLAIQEELEKKNQEMEKLLDALYENEEKFRQLTENINEVFWISDLEQGRMIYVSPSYEDLFGRKPELLYEDHDRWLEAVHPDDLPKLSDSFAGDSTLTHELEYRIIRPDGSIRWIRARGFPVRNESGMIYRYCGVSEDITKRKEAEDKLNLYHEIFINSNDAIVIMEPDGTYREQNPAYRRMNGYEDEELRGQTPALIIGESSFQMIGEHLAKEGSYRGEVIGTTKGGLQKNIELSAFSIRDDKGNNVCHVGFARDITERKRAEDARKQILKDLENANQHLRETQGQLVQSEKMASLGMLVAGIAHEINTPVGAIHSMHDTLKRAVEKLKTFMQTQSQDDFENNREISGPFKTIEDANRVINSGCERVTNIVRRLRSFARLDEAELKTANIHEGLEDTLTLIHHEIKRSITVHKEYGDIPPIPCYPGRLNQIYLNILINARQAIPDKGEIRIRTYEEGEKIHIAISDTGIGIPQDKISRIFDPGFTTKGVGVGTGLGLSIVYRIIQEHKGEIKVQSKVGEGSTFTIILPKNLDVLTKKVTH